MVQALDAELAAIAAELRKITVTVRGHGDGAGVIWRPDGVIVTNAHVAQEKHPEIVLWNGRTLRGRIAAWDPSQDLALLEVPADRLPAVRLGHVASLRVGDVVLALGHPFGVTNAIALGIVHAMNGGTSPRWIQADIRLAPGNSGGPLADARGHVIGINTLIAGGLAYAVPVTAIARFSKQAAA